MPGPSITACSGSAHELRRIPAESYADEKADPAIRPDARRSRRARPATYDCARGYCLARAGTPVIAGSARRFRRTPKGALALMTRGDVPALYWTGVAWGGAPPWRRIRLRDWRGRARARAFYPCVGAGRGMGGGDHPRSDDCRGRFAVDPGRIPARAKQHFDRAVALANGQSAFAYVALATSVAQPAKDKAAFERLLKSALAVDVSARPSIRLANLIAQKRARGLLSQIGRLF